MPSAPAAAPNAGNLVRGGNTWIAGSKRRFIPIGACALAADEVLHEVKTDHQHLVIFKNKTWGTVLMLDGVCQLTTSDEFIYHEMMAHVPLMALDKPKRVLVVGGGDGGVMREVLKHPTRREGDAVRDRPRGDRHGAASTTPRSLAIRSMTSARSSSSPTAASSSPRRTSASTPSSSIHPSRSAPPPCCTRRSSSPPASMR